MNMNPIYITFNSSKVGPSCATGRPWPLVWPLQPPSVLSLSRSPSKDPMSSHPRPHLNILVWFGLVPLQCIATLWCFDQDFAQTFFTEGPCPLHLHYYRDILCSNRNFEPGSTNKNLKNIIHLKRVKPPYTFLSIYAFIHIFEHLSLNTYNSSI